MSIIEFGIVEWISGCIVSKKLTTEEFIEKARAVWGDKYGYEKVIYVDSKSKVEVTCKASLDHQPFLVRPNDHARKIEPSGCPECGKLRCVETKRMTYDDLLAKVQGIHEVGLYRYELNELHTLHEPSTIICMTCRDTFKQSLASHIWQKAGCIRCKNKRQSRRQTIPHDVFVAKCTELHNGYYSYEKTVYVHNTEYITITCPKHGDFEQIAQSHYQGHGCFKCSNGKSQPQEDLANFVKELGFTIVDNYKLPSGKHIDVYIPILNLGIEFNGVYFHTENFGRDRHYHLGKTNEAQGLGIRLVHIFSDEWSEQLDKCKMLITILLGKCLSKRNARELKVERVDWMTVKDFQDKNHLQKCSVYCEIVYRLTDGIDTIAIMSFTSKNVKTGEIELMRFCSNGIVRGGFSKLLAKFVLDYGSKFSSIVSFSDKRWSVGKVYEVNGFVKDYDTPPQYYWVKDSARYNRRGFQHKYLKTKLTNYDPNLTEAENCRNNGYCRIWDCGMSKWRLNLTA